VAVDGNAFLAIEELLMGEFCSGEDWESEFISEEGSDTEFVNEMDDDVVHTRARDDINTSA
jgi:hypothetical protein